jgi:Tfp pilus assembly protein PilN
MFEFNLLPDGEGAPRIPTPPVARPRFGVAVSPRGIAVVALVSVITGWILLHHLRAQSVLAVWEERWTAADHAARGSAAQIEVQEELELARDSLIARLDRLQTLEEGRAFWPAIWLDIAMAVPKAVWVVRFEQVAPAPEFRLVLEGRSLDYDGITTFMEQLSRLPALHHVRLVRVEGRSTTAQDGLLEDDIHHFDIEMEG